MKKTLRRLFAMLCATVMTFTCVAPTANAAVINSGDEWITTSNGLSVKLEVMFHGEDGAGVVAGLDQGDFTFDASTANYADVFDGNTSTGVIFRDGSGTWDGTLLAGDYIQVEFEEAVDFASATYKFDAGTEGNDMFTTPVFSYTTDGETWTDAATLDTATEVTYTGDIDGVKAIRLTNQGARRAWIKLLDIVIDAQVADSGSGVSDRVQGILDGMTLRQKITQMLMVDFRYWDMDTTDDVAQVGFTEMNDQVRQIVEDYDFGALIYFAQNLVGTEQAYNLTMAMQEAATKDGGIPMIISADQEGGSVYRLATGTALPGNMALGATFDTENAKAAGQIIGSELSALGINTNLAPVVDVNNNANNPVIGLRSYGDDATAVGEMASAAIAGMAEYNVIGCAKHFPGHGDTATDSHYGLPMVDKSLDVLLENELKPYEVAIEQGIEMIMTAHILYPQLESDTIVSNKTGEAESLPATMSDDILTDLLKGEMGFEGIIVTDAMNMAGISAKWDQVQSVVVAISAGVDMICMPCTLYNQEDLADLDAIIEGVEAAVADGTISEERINDAVTRILTVKENRGILDYDAADYTLEAAKATVGSDENRAKEREIAAKAVTLIKNENNVLPLDIQADTNVLMLVPYNNEVSQMLMGWNRAVEAGIIPAGAEVDYYRFNSATINETLQAKLEWADVVIMNSEISSTARMAYKHWLSALPNAVCDYCAENDKISVVVSVDKPYDVQLYPNADAILAAYGCKGSAVDPTEALVGGATSSEAAYGPNIIAGVEVALGTFGASGKLPVNIPVYDVESNTYTETIAYERGYGLTYEAKEPIPFPFEDVAEDSYYYGAIEWAWRNNVAAGTSETTFEPEADITRAEAVTFIWRAAGSPTVETAHAFTDIPADAYYADAVNWAVANGIAYGTSATTFEPEATCTRGQVVTFLWRAAGGPTGAETGAEESNFVDVGADTYYYEAINWAVANGIAYGINEYNFAPNDTCTRGQVVTFIYRAN